MIISRVAFANSLLHHSCVTLNPNVRIHRGSYVVCSEICVEIQCLERDITLLPVFTNIRCFEKTRYIYPRGTLLPINVTNNTSLFLRKIITFVKEDNKILK